VEEIDINVRGRPRKTWCQVLAFSDRTHRIGTKGEGKLRRQLATEVYLGNGR